MSNIKLAVVGNRPGAGDSPRKCSTFRVAYFVRENVTVFTTHRESHRKCSLSLRHFVLRDLLYPEDAVCSPTGKYLAHYDPPAETSLSTGQARPGQAVFGVKVRVEVRKGLLTTCCWQKSSVEHTVNAWKQHLTTMAFRKV